jgi:DNA-binding transcriptional MerR regulator
MSPESIRTPQLSEATEPNTDARYQIGEVADRTGVTQRTLRFYEEKGLLTPADRMEGGFRLYSDSDVERIRLIKQLQQLLGFSLAEIKEMVEAEETRASLRAQRERAAGAKEDPAVVKPRAEQTLRALRTQLNVVEPKLRQLTELRADLVERIERVERRIRELERELAGEPVATP